MLSQLWTPLANKRYLRDFMEKVEDGDIEITAHDFPSFLYENGIVYDPDDEVTGLFRGFLLVRVCLLSFVGFNDLITFYRFFVTFSLGHRRS